MTKRELVKTKQEKGFERVKTFRGEMLSYREQWEQLKREREESVCVLESSKVVTLTSPANIDQSLRAPRTKTT
jgi:Golgi SNAP receptor complex protein 2